MAQAASAPMHGSVKAAAQPSLAALPDTSDISIVFFGSGPVAAQALERLARDFSVEAVITKPQPPHHRGEFPVLALAQQLGLHIMTVQSRRELDELLRVAETKPAPSRSPVQARPFQSQLGVLVDFGIIVSQAAIEYFPLGIVNSHFSVLPEWRGADPISFAILSGQKQTGVSIMRLTAGLDEGPLLGYGEYDMPPGVTAPVLTADLIELSHALLLHELPRLVAGQAQGVPQDRTGRPVSYSRKLTKEDGILDFGKPAVELEREVRAFLEWPRSRTTITGAAGGGTEVVVTAAHVEPGAGGTNSRPGTLWRRGKTFGFYTADGILAVDRLKPAGKPEMSAEAFLAGYGQWLA